MGQAVPERRIHGYLWDLRDVFIRLYSTVQKHLRSELLHVIVVVEINCVNYGERRIVHIGDGDKYFLGNAECE